MALPPELLAEGNVHRAQAGAVVAATATAVHDSGALPGQAQASPLRPRGRSTKTRTLDVEGRSGTLEGGGLPGNDRLGGIVWGGVGAVFLLAGACLEMTALMSHAEPSHRLDDVKPWPSSVQSLTDTTIMASMIAVDSIVAAVTVPLLPELSQGHRTTLLYFSKSFVAFVAAVALPPLLRSNVHSARLLAAAGLILLSLTCLAFAAVTCFVSAMAVRMIAAVASTMIVVPVLYISMLQDPAENAGWRMDVAMYGAVLGPLCGPWVGACLMHLIDLPAVMVILSAACTSICYMHLVVTRRIAERPGGIQQHPRECEPQESVFQVASALLFNAKQSTLLVGIGLSVAVLSLHNTLVPAYLEQPEALMDSTQLLGVAGCAGVLMGLVTLACGSSVDALAEPWAFRGMVVAHVIGILGMRVVTDGQSSLQPFMCSFGLFTSQVGTGAYLGLAIPTVLRISKGCSAFPTQPVAAVASAALGAAWFLGDALGVSAQMVLHSQVGYRSTILGFAVAVAAHAAVLIWQPWARGKRTPPGTDVASHCSQMGARQ